MRSMVVKIERVKGKITRVQMQRIRSKRLHWVNYSSFWGRYSYVAYAITGKMDEVRDRARGFKGAARFRKSDGGQGFGSTGK